MIYISETMFKSNLVTFDFSQLGKYSKEVIERAVLEMPKEIDRFLKVEAGKMRTLVKKNQRVNVKSKTGRYSNSFKIGKVYTYDGAKAIRTYSNAPHANLLEYGHIVHVRSGSRSALGKTSLKSSGTGKRSVAGGFSMRATGQKTKAFEVFKKSEAAFPERFYVDCDKLIDKLLDKGV